MSHQKKIEQVLDLLINEEHDAASELLHSVIVEKARSMYEELVDEDFGGDAKEDFAADIAADKGEVEAEEIYDDEEAKDGDVEADVDADAAVEVPADGEVAGEEEVEDRVEDLEAQLAELRAEFDSLVGGDVEGDVGVEGDVAVDGDMAVDAGVEGDVEVVDDVPVDGEVAEEGMYEEVVDGLDEATKLQDEVSVDLNKEGKLTGTGKNSKVGATNTESQFTKAPAKADHGGKPHAFNKGGDESGSKASQGKDNTPTSNLKVAQKNQKADEKDGSDKGAKSTLGSKGAPTGK